MASQWSRIARRIRVPTGFCFAAFYVWRARPTALSIGMSLLLVVPGLLLRGYASGYLTKNTQLTVTGPYAYTRNPLYLGSMMMAVGFAAASRRLSVVALLIVLFVAIYLPTIAAEEEFLRATFPGFAAYADRVPRLVPHLLPASGAPGSSTEEADVTAAGAFSLDLYRKHREYNALLGACAIYAALVAGVLLRR